MIPRRPVRCPRFCLLFLGNPIVERHDQVSCKNEKCDCYFHIKDLWKIINITENSRNEVEQEEYYEAQNFIYFLFNLNDE